MKRRAFLAGAGTGALTAVWPAFGQTPHKVYRLGFLAHSAAKGARNRLLAALREIGWRDGENMRFEYAVAGGDAARWDAVARALVEKGCDLIVVLGSHMALPAMRATKTIPLVMMASGFPVEAGIVPSIAHPGGNITGMRFHMDELPGKWMELVRELVPGLRVLGDLDDYVPPFSNEAEVEAGYRFMTRSAHTLGFEIRRWKIRAEADLVHALAEAEGAGVDAFFATSGAIHSQAHNTARIRDFVMRSRLPMMCDLAGALFNGGGAIMAYSATWDEVAERTATFVDRILKGARPGDLPIEQPTRFSLVLNLKNANAIGLTIPRSLLARTDRVIE